MSDTNNGNLSGARLREILYPDDTRPRWGIVLGSGFARWAQKAPISGSVPYEHVKNLRSATVAGHSGEFRGASVSGVPVVFAVGRLHLYEGHSVEEMTMPIRIMTAMGVESLLFTTAVGGIDPALKPGDAVAVSDQINLTGEDPHTATGRFPDTSALFDPDYLSFLAGKGLKRRVLVGVRGPSYETPAEVRALRALGADVVCMSTVLEVLAAAGAGVRVACVAVVANSAGEHGTTHTSVVETVD